jgi:hypothetical protein
MAPELAASGFHAAAASASTEAFAIVEASPSTCFLATSVPPVELSLRLQGGARVARGAALGWCSAAALPGATIWPASPASIRVATVPSARIGGMIGFRETAARASVGPLATWLSNEDLALDASSALRIAGVSEITTTVLADVAPKAVQGARVLALSLAQGGKAIADSPEDVPYLCAPALEPPPPQSICLQARAQPWRRIGDVPVASAQAPLPFWLALYASTTDVDVMHVELQLLGLARRLGALGFEPTVLEGVTELPGGVAVSGRAGEDSVVAVGIGPKPPYVFPYTDGPAWSLTSGAPRVVPLAPGDRITLASAPPPNAPVAARRTIVFRHAAPHP